MEIKSSGAKTITLLVMTIKDYDEDNSGGAIDITSGGTITIQDVHFDNNVFNFQYDDAGAFTSITSSYSDI